MNFKCSHIKQIILIDKMSIAYQLYLMSNTNHIIIPLKTPNPSPQSLSSLTSTALNSPLPLTPPISDHFFWRKTNSAFSKFKVRKDRNTKNQLSLIEDLKNQQVEKKRKVHLVVRERSNKCEKQSLQQQLLTQCPFGYYDPNQAPLCELMPKQLQKYATMQIQGGLNNARSEKQKFQHPKNSLVSSHLKNESKQLQKRDGKVYSRPAQAMLPEEEEGDPFIIIRKDSQTKSKQYKTKFIKKQQFATPNKSAEIQSEGKLRVRNKIIQKSVLRAEELMKSINSVGFSPPIKIQPYKRQLESVKKEKVIEISEYQVIQIESSSESDSGMQGAQIQLE